MRGRTDEAIWLLRKGLDLSTQNRTGNAMMALMLVRQGRFDEAASYLAWMRSFAERRREHGPSDRRRLDFFYRLFAETAFLQGHDNESYEWLCRWSAEMPDNGRPYLMLAAIDALHGREEQARAHMARHRQLLPYSTLRYVEMAYPPSTSSLITQRARLIEGMRNAGLPEGG